jgi:hypothetical protein
VTPFERLWKRCDKECYNMILGNLSGDVQEQKDNIVLLEEKKKNIEDEYKNKRMTKAVYNEEKKKIEQECIKKEELLKRLEENIEEIKLDQKQKLEKVIGKDIIQKVQLNDINENNQVMEEAIEKMDISKEKKKLLRKEAESYVNKTHGTKTEEDAISMFEKKFNVKLDTSQEFYKKYLEEISKDSEYDWYICGKVDGLYSESDDECKKYIVEVKNRIKAFFTSLRDYEKTQVHLYMYMLDIPRAKLVEKYKQKLRITEIYENKEYTGDIIKYLGVFINAFEKKFLSAFDKKKEYITSSQDEKKVLLKRLYISDITKMVDQKIEQELGEDDCLIDDLD